MIQTTRIFFRPMQFWRSNGRYIIIFAQCCLHGPIFLRIYQTKTSIIWAVFSFTRFLKTYSAFMYKVFFLNFIDCQSFLKCNHIFLLYILPLKQAVQSLCTNIVQCECIIYANNDGRTNVLRWCAMAGEGGLKVSCWLDRPHMSGTWLEHGLVFVTKAHTFIHFHIHFFWWYFIL